MARYALKDQAGDTVNVIEYDPPTDAEIAAADTDAAKAEITRRTYTPPDGHTIERLD